MFRHTSASFSDNGTCTKCSLFVVLEAGLNELEPELNELEPELNKLEAELNECEAWLCTIETPTVTPVVSQCGPSEHSRS